MKPDIRWQALLALSGLALILMLLSYQVQSAALCTVSVPASGGTLVEGIVGRPLYLNPLLSDANPVDRQFVDLIFDGLVRYNEKGEVVPGLAREWAWSEDGLTLTFTLQEGLTWHDGQPVTTADVAFTYGLIQDEAFPGPDHLHNLWQSVTITPVDERRIEFSLTQPYTPFIEATTRGILPAHILGDVDVSTLPSAVFNQSPVGTGPFMVQSGQNWQRTGRLRLTPNPTYWRDGTQLNDLEFRFFPDPESLMRAYENGELHAVNSLPPTMIPTITSETGTRLFTSISPRFSALYFNLSESGSNVLKSKEVRQGLAYALDRAGLVDTVLNGQGVEFEGPYLPGTWTYRPELLTAYSHQPETAAALLDSAGLVSAGNGARLLEGAEVSLRLVALDQPEQRAVAEEIVRQWSQSGIGAQLVLVPNVDTLRQTLAGRNYDVALVEIAPPHDPDLYDFWSQEAMVRGQNFVGWNNRRASEALEAGRQVNSLNERIPYYEAFLRQFDADLPSLTLYQHVTTYAMRDDVQQAEIGRMWYPRDRYQSLASWFLNYRNVAVSCPAESSN